MDKIKVIGRDIKVAYNVAKGFKRENVSRGKNNYKLKNNLCRTKSAIRDLVKVNAEYWIKRGFRPKFITLTFRGFVSLDYAKEKFRVFVKKLNSILGFRIAYINVYEYQKRGVPHFHVIVFNCPYIPNKLLAKIWGLGFVRINVISSYEGLVKYVSKYLAKMDFSIVKDVGKRIYTTSRNVKRPIVKYLEGWTDFLKNHLGDFFFWGCSLIGNPILYQTEVCYYVDVSDRVFELFSEFFADFDFE